MKELSDRVTELSTLMGISTLLSSERPLPQVLESVCRLSAEICKSAVSFIHLADGDDDLVCVARYAPTNSLHYVWEGIARIYGRKSIQKGEIVSSSNLLLRGDGNPESQRGPRIGGICAIPLKGRARVVGTITVGYADTHRSSAREKDMLRAVAAQVAMAVERSWLFDRLQQQLARADKLREVATRIGSSLELDSVLDSIVNHASRLLAAEFSAICLVDRPYAGAADGENHGAGRDPADSCTRQLGEGILRSAVGRAIETGRPAIVQSPLPEPPLKPASEVKPEDYRVALAVPLLSRQEVLGALVTCYLEGRRFDDSDISLAEAFAGQAALAIRNARLYEQVTENWLSLEAAINQINNHGISLMDAELNIKYANPATFWMLGVSPKKGEIPLEEWTALLKKGLVEADRLDRFVERIRAKPERTVVADLAARGPGDIPRPIRLISLPLRQGDGTISGRVNLLEEGS